MGLLWFGWYGFNAGSELRVDSTTEEQETTLDESLHGEHAYVN